MAENPDDVFRDYVNPGDPGSGNYEPEKPRIRKLLKEIAGGTAAVGDYQGPWDSDTAYIATDYVQSGGALWLSRRPNVGITPTEGADWTLLLPGVTASDGTITLAKLDAAMAMAVPTLSKANRFLPCITKTGAGAASVRAGTVVKVGSVLVRFASDTAITMPALTVGVDYAVFVSNAGSVEAVAWTADTGTDPTPPVGTWTLIGGFHYAAGGNATGWNTGGNTTPQISLYTLWDINFRPTSSDPRGMFLVANRFWCDYYPLSVDHHLYGTSRYNKVIATGTSKPKLPVLFGGNGATLVSEFDWWAASEIMDSHGKRLLNYSEFQTAAFGVLEELARSVPPVTTGYNTTNNAGATYKDESWTGIWGGNLMTGSYYIWAQEMMYGLWPGNYDFSAAFDIESTDPAVQLFANTHMISNGRARGGFVQENEFATRGALYGGKSGANASSGSRGQDWANGLQTHSANITGRGAANHLMV